MTMKPNTELNTMMFFDDALESERTYLLTELADAVSETRTAADQAAELNEDGEAGLLRLTEIWCAMNGVPAIVIFEGSQSSCWPMWWRRSTPICFSTPSMTLWGWPSVWSCAT